MKFACRAMLALLLPTLALAGAPLRRAESKLSSTCKVVTSGTARPMFELSVSSNVFNDRTDIWLQSLDVLVATNSVRISSYPATTDAEGWPIVGMTPFKLNASQAVKVYVRRSSSQVPATAEVCGLQAE